MPTRPPAARSATAAAGGRRIAVTGATGLVGTDLVAALLDRGDRVVRLTRRPAATAPAGVTDVAWDPAADQLDGAALEGVDAVIHLAGAPVSERWTAAHKREILESRVLGTGLVARTLAGLARPPRVLVSASAVGYYGDTGDRILTEADAPATDFLGTVGREWEAATAPAEAAGIRVVHARLGVVLSPRGGALARLLPPFRLGGGGKIGSGDQWISWISLTDVVGALLHLADRDDVRGAVNVVAPAPVTNATLASTLGDVLGRPAVVTVPAFALRLMFGEMADAMLLAGQRASSARLGASGYAFRHSTLDTALRAELERE